MLRIKNRRFFYSVKVHDRDALRPLRGTIEHSLCALCENPELGTVV